MPKIVFGVQTPGERPRACQQRDGMIVLRQTQGPNSLSEVLQLIITEAITQTRSVVDGLCQGQNLKHPHNIFFIYKNIIFGETTTPISSWTLAMDVLNPNP